VKIQLLHNYGGKLTNEQRILPAIYDGDDPALFGLAHYLVETGHAIVISGERIQTEIVKPDYEALTLDELRDLLAEFDMTEDAIVSDVSAHWKTRHKELVAWFEGKS
jgi:hypothetical protein